MLTDIGLVVIALAWIYQLICVARGDKKLKPAFVVIYTFGVSVLVFDGFTSAELKVALLNLLSLLATLGVLVVWKETK